MREIKDTKRAIVHIGFDGKVHKQYLGPMAKERFENEVKVLRYLESKHCHFVPRLLEVNEEEMTIVTTNCGMIVEKISQEKVDSLFKELEEYGVQHDDAFKRNITYDQRKGRFCLIDFEFSIILETGEGLRLPK
jgi:hypothetical protein